MNLRGGIDTAPPDFTLIAKLNLQFDGRDQVIALLLDLAEVIRDKTSGEREHGFVRDAEHNPVRPRTVVADLGLNVLVGFGLRFFAGDAASRPGDETIPNFPPGGIFSPRAPTRFGITSQIPHYLRVMNADGDKQWLRRNNPAWSDEQLDERYQQWLRSGESDLIILVESDNQFLVLDLWDALQNNLIHPYQIEIVALEQCFQRGDGRDHTGWFDGLSNMQDLMEREPQYYRSKIYLPHPAPAYPGEPITTRDSPTYDGGTYLVHRKYRHHLDKWFAADLEHTDTDAGIYQGDPARDHVIGRHRDSGKVVHRRTGCPLSAEFDAAEAQLAPTDSHILQARGGPLAPFNGPFPPLQPGQQNVFHTQDVRIRRRGINYCELNTTTGEVVYGLHFLCYQNNIQQTGFEFINNIWLMNPMFRLAVDPLLSPENGYIEPQYGCYYFIPPEYRDFPGEVFFA